MSGVPPKTKHQQHREERLRSEFSALNSSVVSAVYESTGRSEEAARQLLRDMSADSEAQKVAALRAMFPALTPDVLSTTLKTAGSVESAVEKLILMASAAPPRTVPTQQPEPKKQPTAAPAKVSKADLEKIMESQNGHRTEAGDTVDHTQLLDTMLLRHKMKKAQVASNPPAPTSVVPAQPAVKLDNTTLISLTGHVLESDQKSIVYTYDLRGVEPTSKDWVGLYIHNRQYANKYTAYQFTNGTTHGEGVFPALLDGFYDIRLFLNGDKVNPVCRSDPILIGSLVPISATLNGRNVVVTWNPAHATKTPTKDWIGLFEKGTKSNKQFIAYKYGNETGSITLGPLPYGQNEFEARYFKCDSGFIYSGKSNAVSVPNRDSLVVNMSPVSKEEDLQVRWTLTSVEPSKSDWIGLFTEGMQNNKSYILSKYTSAGSVDQDHESGIVTFPSSELSKITPGNYELRFFAATKGTYEVHKVVHISIK